MMNEENVLTYTVTLHDAKQAVKFVEIVNGLTGHFDLRAGNYSFDAKSLLGVLSMDPEDVDAVARKPYTAVISDALYGVSDHPHPRLYGTFPHFLRSFARERHVLSIEEAIRKMTSLPASVLGLDKMGMIIPGNRADMNIFDMEELTDRATYEDSRRLCTGMARVLIGGQDALLAGQMTGTQTGQVLRMKSSY